MSRTFKDFHNHRKREIWSKRADSQFTMSLPNKFWKGLTAKYERRSDRKLCSSEVTDWYDLYWDYPDPIEEYDWWFDEWTSIKYPHEEGGYMYDLYWIDSDDHMKGWEWRY